MKIKTSSLIGKALDWAVQECEFKQMKSLGQYVKQWVLENHANGECIPSFSEDWSLFGKILSREEISINRDNEREYIWAAWAPAPIRDESEAYGYGNTQLIAACRCYVNSILGDEVDIPDQLSEAGKSK